MKQKEKNYRQMKRLLPYSFFIHALEEMKPESTKALLSLYDYLILLFDF